MAVHWFNPAVWIAWFLFGRDMEISCGMGQIQLELNGKAHYEDYNYDISCAAGNVEIGHMNFAGVGVKRTIDNNSGKHVDVDCGMGEVEISF